MRKVTVLDLDMCNGCRACEMVCSMMHSGEFDPSATRIKVYKIEEEGVDIPIVRPTCDLCGGRPSCVEYCPTRVLRVADLSDDEANVLDSLEFCVFASRGRTFTDLRPFAKALTAATGVEYTWRDLLTVGERVCNLERAFNVREGLTRRDDTLPQRFLTEPAGRGNVGSTVDLEPMLNDYYRARGWNVETGIPTRTKLEALRLQEAAGELTRMGKLTP